MVFRAISKLENGHNYRVLDICRTEIAKLREQPVVREEDIHEPLNYDQFRKMFGQSIKIGKGGVLLGVIMAYCLGADIINWASIGGSTFGPGLFISSFLRPGYYRMFEEQLDAFEALWDRYMTPL